MINMARLVNQVFLSSNACLQLYLWSPMEAERGDFDFFVTALPIWLCSDDRLESVVCFCAPELDLNNLEKTSVLLTHMASYNPGG